MDYSLDLLPDRNTLERGARNQIRKHSLNPYNRLHSIQEDIEFVQGVHENCYSTYPLLANLRCGAWYCDSRKAGGITSHFKSADGHYNGWSFNLRRPNLHILPLVEDAGGICIVDSTRSGKRMPDSLSKTVSIWCAVINRTLKLRGLANLDHWDSQLYTPPQSVSKQEHDQIEGKLDDWAESLAGSSYDLPRLKKPLRPIWITPASATFPSFDEETLLPVICISASKMLEEGTERRRHGYSYVQGAGDDHENWSEGLTPEVFWSCKDELLEATEAELLDIMKSIIREARRASRPSSNWTKPPSPVARVKGFLSIATLKDFSDYILASPIAEETPSPCVFIREQSGALAKTPVMDMSSLPIYVVVIPSDKKAAERTFKACLSGCLAFMRQYFEKGLQVCVACETGKDLSVGVVLVALQTFFDDNGEFNPEPCDLGELKVTKDSLRTRLHWIISSRPEANPSRATLKRINEFFMSPSHTGSPRNSNNIIGISPDRRL